MALSQLPKPILAWLDAVAASDTSALTSAFHAAAVVTDARGRHSGPALRPWLDARVKTGARLHPINFAQHVGFAVLSAMVSDDSSGSGAKPRQVDLRFELQKDLIVSLSVLDPIPRALPEPVAAFLQAMNSFDPDAVTATFAPDALVNDQLREIWGLNDIRRWAEQDLVADRVTLFVTEIVERHGHAIVRGNMDGDYDKRGLPDPLSLSFHFFAPAGQILRLLILHNPAIL